VSTVPNAIWPRAADGVEDPADLRTREVRVEEQAGLRAELRLDASRLQRRARGRGATALPDDRAVDGLARLAVPEDRRLALVGDADRGDLPRGDAALGQRRVERAEHGRPDLVGLVLDPTRLRVVLRKLTVLASENGELSIQDDDGRSRRPLVDGDHIGTRRHK
jgi:hypothetical protein